MATAAGVYAAAEAGDEAARAVVAFASRYVAWAIHGLLMTYDVAQVVLGGGVTRAGAAFLDPVLAALDEMAQASPLARAILAGARVQLLPPDSRSATWGAIYLAQEAAGAAHGQRRPSADNRESKDEQRA
jgi:predicted NBD/HSP70 family sugar kinase